MLLLVGQGVLYRLYSWLIELACLRRRRREKEGKEKERRRGRREVIAQRAPSLGVASASTVEHLALFIEWLVPTIASTVICLPALDTPSLS
jgi:hypothetical protein